MDMRVSQWGTHAACDEALLPAGRPGLSQPTLDLLTPCEKHRNGEVHSPPLSNPEGGDGYRASDAFSPSSKQPDGGGALLLTDR